MIEVTEILTNIRKTVFKENDEEIVARLVNGYIFHYQNRLLAKEKGKTALKYIEKVINKSNDNCSILETEKP